MDYINLIKKSSQDLETTNMPKSAWRKTVHRYVCQTHRDTNTFDIVIMIFIVLNMLQIAITHENQSMILTQA